MDTDKIARMREVIGALHDNHAAYRRNIHKLIRLCLRHLEDRRRLLPDDVWKERKELIDALKLLTMSDNHDTITDQQQPQAEQ